MVQRQYGYEKEPAEPPLNQPEEEFFTQILAASSPEILPLEEVPSTTPSKLSSKRKITPRKRAKRNHSETADTGKTTVITRTRYLPMLQVTSGPGDLQLRTLGENKNPKILGLILQMTMAWSKSIIPSHLSPKS